MPSREAQTSKPSGWTSVRRPNAKSRDRRRKRKTLACHKKKPESRIRPAFDHKEQQGPVAFGGRTTDSFGNVVIPKSRFSAFMETLRAGAWASAEKRARGHGQWSEAFGREALEASRCGTRSRTVKSKI